MERHWAAAGPLKVTIGNGAKKSAHGLRRTEHWEHRDGTSGRNIGTRFLPEVNNHPASSRIAVCGFSKRRAGDRGHFERRTGQRGLVLKWLGAVESAGNETAPAWQRRRPAVHPCLEVSG